MAGLESRVSKLEAAFGVPHEDVVYLLMGAGAVNGDLPRSPLTDELKLGLFCDWAAHAEWRAGFYYFLDFTFAMDDPPTSVWKLEVGGGCVPVRTQGLNSFPVQTLNRIKQICGGFTVDEIVEAIERSK